jgi:hypothetical protein
MSRPCRANSRRVASHLFARLGNPRLATNFEIAGAVLPRLTFDEAERQVAAIAV